MTDRPGRCTTLRWLPALGRLLPALLLPSCIIWAPVNVGTPIGPEGVAEIVVKEAEGWIAPGKVAVLSIDGVLSTGDDGSGLLAGSRNTVADVVAQLQRARRDDDVRALVLRIDSPGGSVTAADLIYRELRRFRQDTGRPIIACMMDVAASGGYYVALAADEIWALPTTTTGSIGVITQLMSVEGLFDKIGLQQRTIKSGEYKDVGSPFRPLSEQEQQMLQDLVDAMHERFVDVVVQGRSKLSRERIAELADGRIFTADEALEHGLVDSVGYLDDAVAAARGAANLRDAEVVAYRVGWGRHATLYSTQSAPAPAAALDLGLDRWLPSVGSRLLYLWRPGL